MALTVAGFGAWTPDCRVSARDDRDDTVSGRSGAELSGVRDTALQGDASSARLTASGGCSSDGDTNRPEHTFLAPRILECRENLRVEPTPDQQLTHGVLIISALDEQRARMCCGSGHQRSSMLRSAAVTMSAAPKLTL